jgi:hypothetical protein
LCVCVCEREREREEGVSWGGGILHDFVFSFVCMILSSLNDNLRLPSMLLCVKLAMSESL